MRPDRHSFSKGGPFSAQGGSIYPGKRKKRVPAVIVVLIIRSFGTKNNQRFDDLVIFAIVKGFEARSRTQAASRKNYEQSQSIMDQFFAFCRSMAIAKSEYQERLDIVLL